MSYLTRAVSLGLLSAFLIAGCATTPRWPTAAAPYHDSLVVPNQRIGSAVLGMNETQMLEWLGRPDETVGSGDAAYRFRRKGLQIAFSLRGAYMVAVTKPGFATADGVSVGMTEQEVRAKWDEPTRSQALERCMGKGCTEMKVQAVQHCFGNGMQIDVDPRNRRVTLLQVSSGGCALP